MSRHQAKIKWDLENKERLAELKSAWYARNKERLKEMQSTVPIEVIRERWRIIAHNKRARKRNNGGVISKNISKRLFSLQRGRCACCKTKLANGYHIDHVHPIALGGRNEDKNLQLLCPPCNLNKSAKHPVDFMQQRGFLL